MANLDVTDVLSDPDFVDYNIVGIRRSQSIGDNGRSVNTDNQFLFNGSVQAGGGDVDIRTPQGERITADMVIFTTTALSAGSGDVPADQVMWANRKYIVKSVSDWGNYASGYYMVACDLLPLKG